MNAEDCRVLERIYSAMLVILEDSVHTASGELAERIQLEIDSIKMKQGDINDGF